MFEFLTDPFLGKPLWMWLSFMTVVAGLLAFDLGVLHRKNREIGVGESLKLSAMYITLGVLFGGWVWLSLGSTAGAQYLTGFVVEKTLAMDNVFVIALIFATFAIPRQYQHRVLFWGILGVIVLRGIMIGVGSALVSQFSWILYIFAAVLIFTGIKMLRMADQEDDQPAVDNAFFRWLRRRLRVTPELHGDRFFVRLPDPVTGRMVLWMTPLFLTLIFVEFADVIFAVDSVPAIFTITTDPFIVYTSNVFAILGLRALYFALSAILHRFHYLKPALAALLVFIGSKIFIADLMGWEKFPAEVSLGVTFALLGAGVAWSLWKTRREPMPLAVPAE